ncbi:hypothetical protein [Dactylosporangium siamense]|uniref:hypothetical protein n=1 Tax=Dactylosporangium siamense TaxID=685454 RepID=UPI002FE8F8B5
MARYTITIEADDDSGARTTIHLDTSSGAPRVLEYTVSAGSSRSIAALAAPQVDFDALVAAFAADRTTSPAAAAAAAPAAGPAPAAAEAAPESPQAGRRAAKRTARPKRTAATPAAAAGEQVYRRMPDAAELVGAYHEAESVVRLAQQYDVPRHTMNGWLTRLRRQGLLDGR